jgi:pimeloyl-ACP methyl ester carboxylesterase
MWRCGGAQVPYEGVPAEALVHTGFYNAWTDVAPQVVAEVTTLQTRFPAYTVACVGHSLGGALALHCSADLRQRGFNVTAYTYGQPRVGNAAFSDWYSSIEPNGLRVSAYGDIYTQLPPQAFDYRHQKTEVFYNDADGSLRVCDDSGEDPTCSNSVPVGELNGDAHLPYLGLIFGRCYLS